MPHDVLMVAIVDSRTHLLPLKRLLKGFRVAEPPVFDADTSTLEEKCKDAREIYIISDFPGGNHYWENFPKVPRRHLEEVVVREAREEFGYVGPVRVAFHDVGETVQNGVPKRVLSCVVVDYADVFRLENEIFRRFQNKIQSIYSLPSVLAAAVSHAENPTSDFMVVAIGDHSTTILISSPKGDVRVARQIPVGFGKDMDASNGPLCKSFFQEIAKDLTTTNLYYLQTCQGSECGARYVLGSPALERALDQHGSELLPYKFGFSKPPLWSMDLSQAAALAHLYGALYCHRSYNLLSSTIQLVRTFNKVHRVAMVAIITAIVSCAFFLFQIGPVDKDKIDLLARKREDLQTLKQEVAQLKERVATLKGFRGWEPFYQNTYKNQPRWDVLFTETASLLPREMVLENVSIVPGAGKDVQGWNVVINGYLKVNRWEEGLGLLRQFRDGIQRSSHFQVQMTTSKPTLEKENRIGDMTTFSFQITAQLTPRDAKE